MDISDILSTDYVSIDPDTPVSKLRGAFEDPSLKAVLVVDDGSVRGVVTRRQLAGSHHPPDEKAESLVWPIARVAPDEDVREVAQLMLDSDSRVLPVFEGEQLRGVVTADDLLRSVQPFLDAATVGDACSSDLVSVEPATTFGDALHLLREHGIAHLPVVEDGTAVGILSLHDVVDVAARAEQRSQGGAAGGFDEHGGAGSSAGYRSHGGFGAREGERSRMLDLPVRDVMVSPVATVRPDQPLDVAVETMFDAGGSSLVVVGDDDKPAGILTKSDVLEALTWEAEGNRAVQVYGTDLLDDLSYDAIVSMVETFDGMDRDMAVLDAKVHLHEHDETLRGRPLLLARIRLYTDRGLFIASGEGYGARHAINEARDVLERRIRDDKTYGRTKKHPDADYWEKRFGWWLEA
ncbi:MAG: CBS domain-containing protein [Halobacteriales archaeon]